MGLRVDLPGDQWVILRDPATVPNRLRDRVYVARDGLDGTNAGTIPYVRALLGALVEAWSYPFGVPGKEPASLDRDEVTGVQLDAMLTACRPLVPLMELQTDPTPEARKDPGAPFGSSNGSGSPSPIPTPASAAPSLPNSEPTGS